MSADHRPQLDTLRFLAFLSVFLYRVLGNYFPWGYLGVPFFFALSGFLITRLLVLNETSNLERDLGSFYLRRTLRIFPLYYAVLVFLSLVGYFDGTWPGGEELLGQRPPALWYYLYAQNIYIFQHDAWTDYTNHFWSLCVEEQFYLLYPLMLLAVPRSWRWGLLLVLLLGSLATRWTLDRLYPDSRAWALLPVAGEYLLWGCLAGLYDVQRGERPLPTRLLLVVGVLLEMLTVADQFRFQFLKEAGLAFFYQTLHAVAYALVILAVWRLPVGPIRRLLCWPVTVYLGRISYGLYIFHPFCLLLPGAVFALLPGLAAVRGLNLLIIFLGTVGLAMLSWHAFEAPINRLKDRWAPLPDRSSRGPAPTLGPETTPLSSLTGDRQ